jgi:hypothetical protein
VALPTSDKLLFLSAVFCDVSLIVSQPVGMVTPALKSMRFKTYTLF